MSLLYLTQASSTTRLGNLARSHPFHSNSSIGPMQKHAVGIAVATACLMAIAQAYVERRKALRDCGDTCESRLIRQKVCTESLDSYPR